MISTVEDLITQVIEAGRKQIDGMKIQHRPSIGDMYEGLTKSVLEKAIFDGLNLNIVTGSFIKNSKEELSREMDVMLIEGEAEKLPFSERTIVRENQIIAVFQVKKTLNKELLSEAYFNLTNVYDICELEDPPQYTSRILLDSYRSIFNTGVHTSKRPITKYFESTTADHIWHSLRAEACLPLRIVVGYQGYASEPGLRESFIGFLRANQYVQGFSPLHFPNLIISNQFSLLKCNGMPYVSRLDGCSWPFFTSSSNKPILHLLELIWTRLTYRFNLDAAIFGDDLEIEGVNRFTDPELPIPTTVQTILAYLVGFTMSLYVIYYFYKVFDLKHLKFFATYGLILFLFLPFAFLFVVPFLLTKDTRMSAQLTVIVPFFYGLGFLYSVSKALWKKFKTIEQEGDHVDDPLYVHAKFAYISMVCWAALPVIVFFGDFQVLEHSVTNAGFLMMIIIYIKSAIKQSRREYDKLLTSERNLQSLNKNLKRKVRNRTKKLEEVMEARKTTFINLAHETKTPLTLINNYLSEAWRE